MSFFVYSVIFVFLSISTGSI